MTFYSYLFLFYFAKVKIKDKIHNSHTFSCLGTGRHYGKWPIPLTPHFSKLLDENFLPSAKMLKIFQLDSEQNIQPRPQRGGWKRSTVKWPSQSAKLCPQKICGGSWSFVLPLLQPRNLNGSESLCKEESAKTPPKMCATWWPLLVASLLCMPTWVSPFLFGDQSNQFIHLM